MPSIPTDGSSTRITRRKVKAEGEDGLRRSKRLKTEHQHSDHVTGIAADVQVAPRATKSKSAGGASARNKTIAAEKPVKRKAKTTSDITGKGKEKEDDCTSSSEVDKSKGTEGETLRSSAKRHILLVWLRYWIYDSPRPSSFFRSLPAILPRSRKFIDPPPRPSAKSRYSSSEVIELVLTSQIGHGACGQTHAGTLGLSGKGSQKCKDMDVACKIAETRDQRKMLQGEYETYLRLAKKGVFRGIPTVFGFFTEMEEGGPNILVMKHAGHPLHKHKLRVDDAQRQEFIDTLLDIHKSEISHGDLEERNLLIDTNGRAIIIDFSHAEFSAHKNQMRRELDQLQKIIDKHNAWVDEQNVKKKLAEATKSPR